MDHINDAIRVINLARTNASKDLCISNEILALVDQLVLLAEQDVQDKQKIAEVTKELIDIALRLTNQSKEMSSLIGRLAGAL